MDGDNAMQAIAERIEARYPRGTLVRLSKTDSFAGITVPAADVTGLQAAGVQLYGGRWYRLTFTGLAQVTSAGARALAQLRVDGAGVKDWNADLTTGAFAGFNVSYVFSIAAGAHSVGAAVGVSPGGTMTLHGGPASPAQLWLEDIGPTSLAAEDE
jgi:hypothetical protein